MIPHTPWPFDTLAVALQCTDVCHVRSPSVPHLPNRRHDVHDVAPPDTTHPRLDRRGFKIGGAYAYATTPTGTATWPSSLPRAP